MKEENIKRIRLLRIWEILKQETDEEHPMGTPELIKKLEANGIECDRRTLYGDIKVLKDFGYEIICTALRQTNITLLTALSMFPKYKS